jgi:probable rRNA maturation factor
MPGEPEPYKIDIEVDDSVSAQFESSGVDMAYIVEAVAAVLRWHALDSGIVSLLITDDRQMQIYNRDYRGFDAPTDVLSFVQQDAPAPTDGSVPDELAKMLAQQLGDLIIALPYTQIQARRYGTTLASELRLLVVHGTLHLLGYDHATADERAVMWRVQDAILTKLGEQPHSDREYD